MNFTNRAIVVLLASFLFPPSFLRADGGTVRLSERRGGHQITVFTAPTPFRAGPVDVSVFVQDAETGETITDVGITVRAALRGRPGEAIGQAATNEAATNKLFHAALFELPEPGWWQFEIAVEGERGPARVRFEAEAGEALPRWVSLWPWFSWPAVAIGLFGLHQVLARRSRHPGRTADFA
jgi:hypothetical protein